MPTGQNKGNNRGGNNGPEAKALLPRALFTAMSNGKQVQVRKCLAQIEQRVKDQPNKNTPQGLIDLLEAKKNASPRFMQRLKEATQNA